MRENLGALDMFAGAELIEADAVTSFGKTRRAARCLPISFFSIRRTRAPKNTMAVLEFLDTSHLIAPQGMVIVEHSKKMQLIERLDRLEATRSVEQGDAVLSFYRLAAAA